MITYTSGVSLSGTLHAARLVKSAAAVLVLGAYDILVRTSWTLMQCFLGLFVRNLESLEARSGLGRLCLPKVASGASAVFGHGVQVLGPILLIQTFLVQEN